tara:strand:- start:16575 stop:18284 length:1710 start_codon:yes stop_codon:yes gene_type:complete
MEEPGSPPKGKWNIQDFSLDDLLDALNLPPDPTASQVTDAANSVIARMRAQGQMDEARFFEQAKAELLSALRDDDGLEKEYNEQNDQETMMGNWWNNEYPAQGDQTQAEKATSRHQKVQFFPNSHFQMNRERLGVNQTYNVPVMQGTINPNQRNVTQRMVFIDSSQKQNLTLCSELNTDFTLDLSEPLTNVLQMHLHSVHLPNTWYTFSPHLGNTTATVAFSSGVGQPVETHCIDISAGNYSGHELAAALTAATPGALGAAFTFEPKTNKITIMITSGSPVVFTFYSPTGLPQTTDLSHCSQTACKSMFRNQNLGWSLGLRDLQTDVSYNGTATYANPPGGDFTVTLTPNNVWPAMSAVNFTPCAPVDTYGPKSFFLVVDDYNQNRLNKGVVSMTDRPTKLSVPTYVEPGLVDPYTGDISCASVTPPPGMTGPARAGRVVKTYPRRLTQAQIYTANEIMANRNTPDFRVPPVSADNVLAVIPLSGIQRTARITYEPTGGPPLPVKDIVYPPTTPFIATGTDLLANERSYFGPVDIERMRVKLIDDRGNVVDLNSTDWSFTLCVEELYQY